MKKGPQRKKGGEKTVSQVDTDIQTQMTKTHPDRRPGLATKLSSC